MHINEGKSLDLLPMSRRTLERQLKKVIGVTPKRYLSEKHLSIDLYGDFSHVIVKFFVLGQHDFGLVICDLRFG